MNNFTRIYLYLGTFGLLFVSLPLFFSFIEFSLQGIYLPIGLNLIFGFLSFTFFVFFIEGFPSSWLNGVGGIFFGILSGWREDILNFQEIHTKFMDFIIDDFISNLYLVTISLVFILMFSSIKLYFWYEKVKLLKRISRGWKEFQQNKWNDDNFIKMLSKKILYDYLHPQNKFYLEFINSYPKSNADLINKYIKNEEKFLKVFKNINFELIEYENLRKRDCHPIGLNLCFYWFYFKDLEDSEEMFNKFYKNLNLPQEVNDLIFNDFELINCLNREIHCFLLIFFQEVNWLALIKDYEFNEFLKTGSIK